MTDLRHQESWLVVYKTVVPPHIAPDLGPLYAGPYSTRGEAEVIAGAINDLGAGDAKVSIMLRLRF